VNDLSATVAVASRDRPLRLRWLLNALAEQTFPAERFEVIVAHDPSSPETERLLRTHPLRSSGQLRQVTFPVASTFPGGGRNAAWRAGQAPLTLFTDDDCRPAEDWVERAVAAANRHPGAIVQGMTLPDPDESATLRGAPWVRTQHVAPPTPWAEACNIVYPTSLLQRVGGFSEEMRVGEDADLALRAQRVGARLIAAPEMLVYHAVEERFLPGTLRALGRWRDLALLIKRHPRLRGNLCGGLWWKPEHAALSAAAVGAAVGRRHRAGLALAVPWVALTLRQRGYRPRAILRSLSEVPGRAAIDATEMLVLAQGSVRYRTLLL
jgi:GT2 family glycosyltransferase